MIRFIRNLLGRLLMAIDWLTRPTPPQRSAEAQAKIDRETENLALYQFRMCPFCIKTRRAMRRLGLKVQHRDALHDPTHRQRLEQEGGQLKVPCLAIEEGQQTRWMYESNDIIAYLEQRFSES
jgi:glutaredoxin